MAEAEAEMQRMEAQLLNDTEIARAKRDFDLKKATYDVEVNTAKAEAEKAYELQVLKKFNIFSKYLIQRPCHYIFLIVNAICISLKLLSIIKLCIGRTSSTTNQRTTNTNSSC